MRRRFEREKNKHVTEWLMKAERQGLRDLKSRTPLRPYGCVKFFKNTNQSKSVPGHLNWRIDSPPFSQIDFPHFSNLNAGYLRKTFYPTMRNFWWGEKVKSMKLCTMMCGISPQKNEFKMNYYFHYYCYYYYLQTNKKEISLSYVIDKKEMPDEFQKSIWVGGTCDKNARW